MSIAGGLFNSNNKEENLGDTKSTADGEGASGQGPVEDLTTSIPGFDDPDIDADADDSFVIDAGEEASAWVDATGPDVAVDDLAVDATPDVPLDPES